VSLEAAWDGPCEIRRAVLVRTEGGRAKAVRDGHCGTRQGLREMGTVWRAVLGKAGASGGVKTEGG
jgi:hypothetical protein